MGDPVTTILIVLGAIAALWYFRQMVVTVIVYTLVWLLGVGAAFYGIHYLFPSWSNSAALGIAAIVSMIAVGLFASKLHDT